MDEECSKIFVALFGDTSEVTAFPGAVFPGVMPSQEEKCRPDLK